MGDPNLWNKDVEKRFFISSMKDFKTPEQLFYVTDDQRYLAYWPKDYKGTKSTLQARNSLIGAFTEKWTTDLIQKVVDDRGLYAVQGAVCDEIALTNRSPADVVISKKRDINLKPEDILLIIEVKMSIVWNWELKITPSGEKELVCIGNYKTHRGNPGILRSDSMLKAIGKSINIRISNFKASKIPIIILGNTPITDSYYSKVDNLRKAGIIQGVWSVNPDPLDGLQTKKETRGKGFYRFDNFKEFKTAIDSLLKEDLNFFSAMKTKKELGQIIELANKEETYERKAEVFLDLIRRDLGW